LAPALLLLDSEPPISLDAGSMLLASGHLGPARFFFERVRRERPGWSSAAALLAAVELQEGRAGSALPHARAAVELAPGNPSMHHLLARSLAATGRWDEAVEARRASLDGGFSALWRSWGSFSRELAAAGDTAAALAALDSARLRASDARVGDSLDAVARSLDPTRPED
jgi:predicted Zn-dependent protease